MWFECCYGLKIYKEEITTFDSWFLENTLLLKKAGREDLFIEMALIVGKFGK